MGQFLAIHVRSSRAREIIVITTSLNNQNIILTKYLSKFFNVFNKIGVIR